MISSKSSLFLNAVSKSLSFFENKQFFNEFNFDKLNIDVQESNVWDNIVDYVRDLCKKEADEFPSLTNKIIFNCSFSLACLSFRLSVVSSSLNNLFSISMGCSYSAAS